MSCQSALAVDLGNLTFFGQIGVSEPISDSIVIQQDELPTAAFDALYTYDSPYIKVLAEGYVDEHNSTLERFTLGLKYSSNGTIWLGKFHNPIEYWLDEYHQGAYAQTSLTNPFESLDGTEGGITTRNVSGFKLSHLFEIGEQSINLDVGQFSAPRLTASVPSVDVSDFIDNRHEDNKAPFFRLRYSPIPMNDSEFGVAYVEGTLAAPDPAELDKLLGPFLGPTLIGVKTDQRAASAFANIEAGNWKVLLSYINSWVDIELGNSIAGQILGEDADSSFAVDLVYLHTEYAMGDELMVFGRYEKAKDTIDTPEGRLLIDALDFDSKYEKALVGLRWDLSRRHALTVQYTDHSGIGQRQDMIHVAWTFAYDLGLKF